MINLNLIIVSVIFDKIIYTNNFSTNFTFLNSYFENINKSQTSLCLTNSAFLFGKRKSFLFLLLPAVL